MSVNALLLAGGHGERLWPLSQPDSPKQCLPIIGGKSFLRCTFERLDGIVSLDNIYVATGTEIAETVLKEVPEIPDKNFIIEPHPRDTAPCIGLAAVIMAEDDPEAVMIALPCDHIIKDVHLFRACLKRSITAARHGYLVTLGIPPEYPATEYGYLECGEESSDLKQSTGKKFLNIDRFVEKPDLKTARSFFESGRYLWNSGIFIWKARRILDEIAIHSPRLNQGLDLISKAIGNPGYNAVLEQEFSHFTSVSIDQAVMEKAHGIVAVEADFRWRDSGNWDSFATLLATDKDGNAVRGHHISIDTTGCVVWSDKPVATMGVDDLVIVSANNAILICARNRARDIKQLLRQFGETKKKET